MATLQVSYVGGVEKGVAKGIIGGTTITTSGATAKTSSAAPLEAGIVVVFSDAAHRVVNGPQATVEASATTGLYVPANVERHFTIKAGDGIAAITV